MSLLRLVLKREAKEIPMSTANRIEIEAKKRMTTKLPPSSLPRLPRELIQQQQKSVTKTPKLTLGKSPLSSISREKKSSKRSSIPATSLSTIAHIGIPSYQPPMPPVPWQSSLPRPPPVQLQPMQQQCMQQQPMQQETAAARGRGGMSMPFSHLTPTGSTTGAYSGVQISPASLRLQNPIPQNAFETSQASSKYGAAAAGISSPFPTTTTTSSLSFYYPGQTPITNSTVDRGKI
ncbi:unnamed protein product [Rotaria sp. Silwood2]|nr:unnamed protein product [Rotaria sp. Silwood2]CAF4253481.1 unnamed protein product [Rotaria sp. Silwood2]